MRLIFEKSIAGCGCDILPECDVPQTMPDENLLRKDAPMLPQLTEGEISRHYSKLERRSFGVNNGFYPLGSCTMKYNPKLNNEMATLPGFSQIHPLQPQHTAQGCMGVLYLAEQLLGEITGMDAMTFQPAAGAHGEYTGIAMIKAYHKKKGEAATRTKMLIPDSAHGTNPASAVMNGYKVVTIPSDENGCVDIDALKAEAGPDTAGLMLTNPNTLGLFEKNICEITQIIHDVGGMVYYDGANLNAIMGIVRPGDMGFDVIHLNLHKTFSTPHGGGGPGSGAVGCKSVLAEFLPSPTIKNDDRLKFEDDMPYSIGKVRSFYGNFAVTLRALVYILTLGKKGIPAAATYAVLNANYLMHHIKPYIKPACDSICMHEFVLSLKELKKDTGVSALDFSKALIDYGMHPPTMYFPLIVDEALMLEPTETETKETLDKTVEAFRALVKLAKENPEQMHNAPVTAPIRRPDEVKAARNPVLKFSKQ